MALDGEGGVGGDWISLGLRRVEGRAAGEAAGGAVHQDWCMQRTGTEPTRMAAGQHSLRLL